MFDGPGAVSTQGQAINDRGEVAGPYVTTDGKTHGYIKTRDTFVNIDPPGAVFTMPFGINPIGEVVGQYRTADGVLHGFLLNRTGFVTIDVPGIVALRGINARGDMVGVYSLGGKLHGFAIWK